MRDRLAANGRRRAGLDSKKKRKESAVETVEGDEKTGRGRRNRRLPDFLFQSASLMIATRNATSGLEGFNRRRIQLQRAKAGTKPGKR